MNSRWTHLALHVRSLNASIAFYERYTNLRVIDRHSDAWSTGMEVIWRSDQRNPEESEFVLVLQEGCSQIHPRGSAPIAARPNQSLWICSSIARKRRCNRQRSEDKRPVAVWSDVPES
jgi:hypothetical protein